jgi:hypothetical protein
MDRYFTAPNGVRLLIIGGLLLALFGLGVTCGIGNVHALVTAFALGMILMTMGGITVVHRLVTQPTLEALKSMRRGAVQTEERT